MTEALRLFIRQAKPLGQSKIRERHVLPASLEAPFRPPCSGESPDSAVWGLCALSALIAGPEVFAVNARRFWVAWGPDPVVTSPETVLSLLPSVMDALERCLGDGPELQRWRCLLAGQLWSRDAKVRTLPIVCVQGCLTKLQCPASDLGLFQLPLCLYTLRQSWDTTTIFTYTNGSCVPLVFMLRE